MTRRCPPNCKCGKHTISFESRQRRSEALTGRTLSEETKQRMSESWHNSTRRESISESIRLKWKEPEYRQSVVESLRGFDLLGHPAIGYSVTKEGYKILSMQYEHPLAIQGYVAEHRVVLYEKIGPGPHLCHWGCGKLLEWGGREGIFADHLDSDPTNNSPENLVPSCNSCNWNRSSWY